MSIEEKMINITQVDFYTPPNSAFSTLENVARRIRLITSPIIHIPNKNCLR